MIANKLERLEHFIDRQLGDSLEEYEFSPGGGSDSILERPARASNLISKVGEVKLRHSRDGEEVKNEKMSPKEASKYYSDAFKRAGGWGIGQRYGGFEKQYFWFHNGDLKFRIDRKMIRGSDGDSERFTVSGTAYEDVSLDEAKRGLEYLIDSHSRKLDDNQEFSSSVMFSNYPDTRGELNDLNLSTVESGDFMGVSVDGYDIREIDEILSDDELQIKETYLLDVKGDGHKLIVEGHAYPDKDTEGLVPETIAEMHLT